jgi:beta-phosphoglucomutase-like phosphatase (HAD superfamily)
MIKAAIFDLDGLLIDSEPLWEEAEMNVFARLGILVTKDICMKVKGLRIDESIKYICSLFPVTNPDYKKLETDIMFEVKRLILEKGKGMPGGVYILHFFRARGMKIALASSSKMEIIQSALKKLGISQNFHFIHSAEYEEFGKPHPSIFITAAKNLGVNPTECVVFEDSLHGVIAAKAARMKVVALPEEASRNDQRFCHC